MILAVERSTNAHVDFATIDVHLWVHCFRGVLVTGGRLMGAWPTKFKNENVQVAHAAKPVGELIRYDPTLIK